MYSFSFHDGFQTLAQLLLRSFPQKKLRPFMSPRKVMPGVLIDFIPDTQTLFVRVRRITSRDKPPLA